MYSVQRTPWHTARRTRDRSKICSRTWSRTLGMGCALREPERAKVRGSGGPVTWKRELRYSREKCAVCTAKEARACMRVQRPRRASARPRQQANSEQQSIKREARTSDKGERERVGDVGMVTKGEKVRSKFRREGTHVAGSRAAFSRVAPRDARSRRCAGRVGG